MNISTEYSKADVIILQGSVLSVATRLGCSGTFNHFYLIVTLLLSVPVREF